MPQGNGCDPFGSAHFHSRYFHSRYIMCYGNLAEKKKVNTKMNSFHISFTRTDSFVRYYQNELLCGPLISTTYIFTHNLLSKNYKQNHCHKVLEKRILFSYMINLLWNNVYNIGMMHGRVCIIKLWLCVTFVSLYGFSFTLCVRKATSWNNLSNPPRPETHSTSPRNSFHLA